MSWKSASRLLQQLIFCEALQNPDVLKLVHQRRPNSKWVVDKVTNITFFVTKLQGHPIRRGTHLPCFLVENHGLVALDRNHTLVKSTMIISASFVP